MSILKAPIVTEKMNAVSEKLGRYGFLVDKNANKIQIKKIVEKTYGVTVESVNTMNYYGKTKVRYTKAVIKGKKNALKKALVTLKKGDTIDFFSNI